VCRTVCPLIVREDDPMNIGTGVAVSCATVTLAITTLPAGPTVLCRKASGVVVARESSCKKKEVRLDPAALGLGSGGYSVVDSIGNTLGAFTGDNYPSAVNVMRREAGHVLRFYVGEGSIDCGGGYFYHETPDCSGARYIPRSYELTQPLQILCDTNGSAQVGYYTGDPIQSHTFASVESTDGAAGCGDGVTCCPIPPNTPNITVQDAGPAVTFDLSPFHPPFHLE